MCLLRNEMKVRSDAPKRILWNTMTDCPGSVLPVFGHRRRDRGYLSCYHNGHIQGRRIAYLSGMKPFSLFFFSSMLFIHPSGW